MRQDLFITGFCLLFVVSFNYCLFSPSLKFCVNRARISKIRKDGDGEMIATIDKILEVLTQCDWPESLKSRNRSTIKI